MPDSQRFPISARPLCRLNTDFSPIQWTVHSNFLFLFLKNWEMLTRLINHADVVHQPDGLHQSPAAEIICPPIKRDQIKHSDVVFVRIKASPRLLWMNYSRLETIKDTVSACVHQATATHRTLHLPLNPILKGGQQRWEGAVNTIVACLKSPD